MKKKKFFENKNKNENENEYKNKNKNKCKMSFLLSVLSNKKKLILPFCSFLSILGLETMSSGSN